MPKLRALPFLLISEAAYVALLLAGDLRRSPAALLAALAGLALLYALLTPRLLRTTLGRSECRQLLVAAALFRLTMLPAAPWLSDDVHRYLWDGRVLRAVGNPYLYAPDDPALASLRDERWALINYPELPTIYPPAAELAFGLTALVPAWQLLAWKIVLLLAELGLLAALGALLERAGLPRQRVLLFALHPLVVIETYGSGHLETLALAALVAAAWIKTRAPAGRAAAGLTLGLSILVKPFGLALVPGALRHLRMRGVAAMVLLSALLYAPFLAAGSNLVRSLWEYGSRWRWYDTGHAAVLGAVTALGTGERLTAAIAWADHLSYGTALREPLRALYPLATDRFVARLVILALFAAVVASGVRRRLSLPRAALEAAAAFCLLTPVLHPWYALWLLPWLALHFSWGAWLATLLVTLSYATFMWPGPAGDWAEPSALKWASLAAVILTLAAEARVRRRRWSGPAGAIGAPPAPPRPSVGPG